MDSIGKKLKELRSSKKMSANDVVSQLKDRNIVISAKTLYGYENDQPIRSSTFLALCEIYAVKNVLQTFLSAIPNASENWEPDYYEDYFNGRTVNEKYEVLSNCGIPTFSGYEKECASDVFFGSTHGSDSISNLDKRFSEVVQQMSEEQREALLSYAEFLVRNDKV